MDGFAGLTGQNTLLFKWMIDEYLFDRRQHPWLRMVISVRPDNQINLLVRGIALEILRQAKERIRRSSLDEIRRKYRGRGRAHDVGRDRSETLLRRRSGRRWRGRGRGKRRRERGRHYKRKRVEVTRPRSCWMRSPMERTRKYRRCYRMTETASKKGTGRMRRCSRRFQVFIRVHLGRPRVFGSHVFILVIIIPVKAFVS